MQLFFVIEEKLLLGRECFNFLGKDDEQGSFVLFLAQKFL